MGTSSYWGVIIVSGQEANQDNLGCRFDLLKWWFIDAILMSTHNRHFYDKLKRMSLKYSEIFIVLSYRKKISKKLKNEFESAVVTSHPLRKHAYSNIENFTTKKWNFSDKKFWYFSYFCSKHRLWVFVSTGSNKYPQSMFLSRNKKNNVYPCKPHVYYIKVGFKGVKII